MGKIIDLGPFRRKFREKQKEFVAHLLKGHSAMTLAGDRVCLELMQADFDKGQEAFKPYATAPPGAIKDNALRWKVDCEILALHKISGNIRDPEAWKRQIDAFDKYAEELKARVDRPYKVIHDTSQKTELWVIRRNLPTRDVVYRIALALKSYVHDHDADEDILRVRPDVAVWTMLEEERKDLAVMLRLATQIPNDISTYTLRTKEPDTSLVTLAQTVVSTVISVIPIVGNAVAAFEIWRGKDIWGNELSEFDRAVLGASIILPVAGRFVKSGKAMYSSERLVKLYGEDARQWSYAMAMGEKASIEAAGLSRIREASKKVATKQAIEKTAAEKLAETFKTLGLDSGGKALVPFTIDAKVVQAFEKVVAKHPLLKDLDAFAMERLIAKGASVNHVKGQMLEELLENRIVALLRDPHGRIALGLGHIKGDLHFIPGHLVRDQAGLQITDGIIVRQLGDKVHIVAVFEAKSGEASARGLALKSTSNPKLSQSAREERQAVAQESLLDLQERARLNGQPPPKTTLEDQIKEITLAEKGGQIRSDIERMSEQTLWINGVEMPVEIKVGPQSTKFFGVLPKDVPGTDLVEALKGASLKNFEIMGMDISSEELIKAAKSVLKEMADFLPKKKK